VFFINCPLGVAVMAAIYFIKMPEREDKHNIKHSLKSFLGALDLPGFSIFCPSIVMMLLALEWGGVTFAWNSAIIIGLFCGSGVIFLMFIAWEYRVGDKAMIPLKLLRNRVVSLGFFLQILQYGCLFLISYYLPIWFQASKQASPINSGLMTLPSLISQIAVGLAVGWLVQRLGHITPFAVLACVATAVGSGLMTTFQPWTGPNLWIGYQILTGSGRGLASQMSLLAVQYNVPKDQVSIGTSLLTFAGTFGATMFIAIGQTAFANLLIPAIAQFAPGVDPQRVIDAGATNLRSVALGLDPYKIVLAYNQALTRMFFLGAGASAASLFFCVGWGDINIKKKKQETAAEKAKEKGEQNV
jgi:Major Facilitator Superfamily